jgi:hypothetical protein
MSMSKAGRLVLRGRSYAGRVDLKEANEQVSIFRVTERWRNVGNNSEWKRSGVWNVVIIPAALVEWSELPFANT